MKKWFEVLSIFVALHVSLFAQSNPDWEVLWINRPDTLIFGPNYWMGVRETAYSGIAYDRFRDVLYIVNPDLCLIGGQPIGCPKIHIWDAATGQIKTSIGRQPNGTGGRLPVPLDTIAGGYLANLYTLYKIDLDDEGRIYACNLVSPIWIRDQLCPYAGDQGPWKMYRWDSPYSAPRLVYSTLNYRHDSLGTGINDSEMSHTRWGDAFEVVGKRAFEGTPPVLVDSTRIFVSGGPFCQQTETNREVNVFLQDRRQGRKFDFRLAIRLFSSLEGIASHGIAVTGTLPTSEIWMDSNGRVTTLNNQLQNQSTWPQTHTMVGNLALSDDSSAGTGPSGPIAFFRLPGVNRSYLICADGRPTNPQDSTKPNHNTTARILDVTNPIQAARFLEVTPKVGLAPHAVAEKDDGNNSIADVDFKIEYDQWGMPYLTLFVLMSNNGIAAFKTKRPLYIPVELTTFDAYAKEDSVHLKWHVALETNNAGFEIQRSFDRGQSWKVVGFVAGRGTTTTPAVYRFAESITDGHRAAGLLLYRLRQVDLDGTHEFSPTAETFVPTSESALTLDEVFPNPASIASIQTIRYHLDREAFVTLSLFNSVGQEIAVLLQEERPRGSHTFKHRLKGVSPGVYIYRLDTGTATLQRKVVVR